MSTEKPHGGQGQQWWLSKKGTPTGPYDAVFILDGLRTGKIPPDTFACLVGGQTWKKLSESATFASACRGGVPQSPPPRPPAPVPSAVGVPPWNPRALGFLGLLFSPLWLGIMAAINTRRLQSALPAWRPVAIGAGATFLGMILSLIIGNSYLMDLVLYLGAIGAIWGLDLQPQVQLFDKQAGAAGRQPNWLTPALVGAPCAIMVFLAFVVAPFMPLEPREVCQRFVYAKSLSEAKKYSTANLWPTIEVLFAHPDSEVKDQWDWGDDGSAPPEIGGHCVECRLRLTSGNGEAVAIGGFFHLRDLDGAWKVEDWYWTAINGQELPEWISVTTIPLQDLSEPQKIVAETKHGSHRGVQHIGHLIHAGHGIFHMIQHDGGAILKMLAAIGAAIVAALAAMGKFFGMKAGSSSSAPPARVTSGGRSP